MPKVSLPEFARSALSIYNGLQQGAQAGQQELDQQQAQQQAQANADRDFAYRQQWDQQQQRNQLGQMLIGAMGNLTPDAQRTAFPQIMNYMGAGGAMPNLGGLPYVNPQDTADFRNLDTTGFKMLQSGQMTPEEYQALHTGTSAALQSGAPFGSTFIQKPVPPTSLPVLNPLNLPLSTPPVNLPPQKVPLNFSVLPPQVNPKTVAALQKEQDAVTKELTTLAQQQPNTPDGAAYRNQVTGVLSLFPNGINNQDDIRRVYAAISAAAPYRVAPGSKALTEAQQQFNTNRTIFAKTRADYLNPDVPLQPEAQAGMLTSLLDQEQALAKTGQPYGAPLFLPHATDINQIRSLLASNDPAKIQQAADLAQNIRRRIVAGISPKAEDALRKDISSLSVADMQNPQVIQAIFQRHGLDPQAMDPSSFRWYTGKALEDRYDKLIGQMKGLANLDPATQNVTLSEIGSLAQALGKNITVPAQVVSQMTPQQRAQLALSRDRLALDGDKYDLQVANSQLDAQKKLLEIQNLQGGGKGPNVFNAQARQMQHDADKAASIFLEAKKRIAPDLKREFNPEGFAALTPQQQAQQKPQVQDLYRLWSQWQAKTGQLQGYLNNAANAVPKPGPAAVPSNPLQLPPRQYQGGMTTVAPPAVSYQGPPLPSVGQQMGPPAPKYTPQQIFQRFRQKYPHATPAQLAAAHRQLFGGSNP